MLIWTGFNELVYIYAPAIEYKKEGQVFGIGVNIFTISGPVILYGIFSSWLLGVLYYLLQMTGIMGGMWWRKEKLVLNLEKNHVF